MSTVIITNPAYKNENQEAMEICCEQFGSLLEKHPTWKRGMELEKWELVKVPEAIICILRWDKMMMSFRVRPFGFKSWFYQLPAI